MEFPFEFCAQRFLLQWQRKERELHSWIKGEPTVDQLRTALRYFKVARNFKGLKTPERAETILHSLLSVRARDLPPEEKVVALADKFKEADFQFNLSAASKLLWLSSRRPFIIYDSRAVAALKKHHSYSPGKKDYAEFCRAWRAAYEQYKDEIVKAVIQLPQVRASMPAWRMSDETLLRMVRRPWFTERVFDIYLWELGSDG